MPRIPHVGGTGATFGQRGPDRIGPAQFNTSGAGAAMDALGATARQTGNAIAELAARRAAEDDQLARAKANNALLDDDLELKAKVDEIRRRVADTSLPYQQAPEEMQTWLSQREARQIDGLDPAAAEVYRGGLKRNAAGAVAQIDGVYEQAKRTDFTAQILATRDKLGKIASDPNADLTKIVTQGAALRDFANAGGIGATFDKDQQAFSDRVYSDNAKARFIAARDSLDGLNQLERDLTEEGGRYFGNLDADRTNAILSQVQVRKGQLEAKAKVEADKGEAIAGRALDAFEKQISSGIAAPLETMTGWSEALSRGTPEQQARWKELLTDEIEVRKVLAMPPAEQRTFLQQRQAKQQREGATLTQQANLSRLEKAVAEGTRQLRDSPLEFYANRTGTEIQPIDSAALLGGNVDAVRKQFADRAVLLSSMRKQFGPETGRGPLLPQEASALAAAVKQMTPDKAIKLYGTMSDAFGDPAAFRAAIQQISPDSPVRALAGTIYSHQRETTLPSGSLFRGAVMAKSGDIARTLLTGEALLNRTAGDKAQDGKGQAFPMPPPKQLETAFASAVGDAFRRNPGAADLALQSVRAYYAGKASESGDLSGEIDEKRVTEAVRAVLGEPVEINGRDVLPPWGMSGADFRDKIEGAWESVIGERVNGVLLPRAGALPAGASLDFDDYTLQQADGGYYVVASNGEYLHMAKNTPLILTVK